MSLSNDREYYTASDNKKWKAYVNQQEYNTWISRLFGISSLQAMWNNLLVSLAFSHVSATYQIVALTEYARWVERSHVSHDSVPGRKKQDKVTDGGATCCACVRTVETSYWFRSEPSHSSHVSCTRVRRLHHSFFFEFDFNDIKIW